MSYVAIVTARAGSQRLKGKNLYPLGGRSLIEISAQHGIDAGLPVIISSDIPEAQEIADRLGVHYVPTPLNLRDSSDHSAHIRAALNGAGFTGWNVVLLQPTSPFRVGGVINACVEKHKELGGWVTTGRDGYSATATGYQKTTNLAGCVMAMNPECGRLGKPHIVETPIINLLEIDEEREYAEACAIYEQLQPIQAPVLDCYAEECRNALSSISDKRITLVGRSEDSPIPQDIPAAYINQCQGYDGGRCDALFLVANEQYATLADIESVRECAQKAKVLIIRDHKFAYKLLAALPNTEAEIVVIRHTASPKVDQATTGALSSFILHDAGFKVNRVGFSSPAKRARDYEYGSDHWKGSSYDNILLSQTGTNR